MQCIVPAKTLRDLHLNWNKSSSDLSPWRIIDVTGDGNCWVYAIVSTLSFFKKVDSTIIIPELEPQILRDSIYDLVSSLADGKPEKCSDYTFRVACAGLQPRLKRVLAEQISSTVNETSPAKGIY